MKMSSCSSAFGMECLMSGGSDNRLKLYYIISSTNSYIELNARSINSMNVFNNINVKRRCVLQRHKYKEIIN